MSEIRTKSVDGKPAILPGEHVGCRRSVEQVSEPEPADHAAPYPLGDRGQISLRDRSCGQERRRGAACSASSRHEDAVGCTHVQMHVVFQSRAEAVHEGDGAEPRAGSCVNHHVCRSAQQPLDLSKKDLREGGDGLGAVGEEASQPLRPRSVAANLPSFRLHASLATVSTPSPTYTKGNPFAPRIGNR